MVNWCTTSGLPSLSNAWNGFNLHINFDHPQVHTFKSKYDTFCYMFANNQHYLIWICISLNLNFNVYILYRLGSTQLSHASSQTHTQTSDSGLKSYDKTWTNMTEVKTIRKINEIRKIYSFHYMFFISHVQDNNVIVCYCFFISSFHFYLGLFFHNGRQNQENKIF